MSEMPGADCTDEQMMFGHLLSGDLDIVVHSLSPVGPDLCLDEPLLLLMAARASLLLCLTVLGGLVGAPLRCPAPRLSFYVCLLLWGGGLFLRLWPLGQAEASRPAQRAQNKGVSARAWILGWNLGWAAPSKLS